MPNSNQEPKYSQGKSKRNQNQLPKITTRRRGSIDPNAFSNVNLTGSKLFVVSLLLSLPYIGTIIALYLNGLTFVSVILIVMGIFVILGILLARWIERSNL
jgi:hypothetical protein